MDTGGIIPSKFWHNFIYFELNLSLNSMKLKLLVFIPSGAPAAKLSPPYQNFVFKWSYLTSRLWSIFKKSFTQTSGSVKVVRVRGTLYISKEEQKAFPSPPTVVDALPVRTSWCTVSAAGHRAAAGRRTALRTHVRPATGLAASEV